jgi:hypothetical protein
VRIWPARSVGGFEALSFRRAASTRRARLQERYSSNGHRRRVKRATEPTRGASRQDFVIAPVTKAFSIAFILFPDFEKLDFIGLYAVMAMAWKYIDTDWRAYSVAET